MTISSARHSTPKSFLGLRGAPKKRVCPKVFPQRSWSKSIYPRRDNTKDRLEAGWSKSLFPRRETEGRLEVYAYRKILPLVTLCVVCSE